MYVNVNFLTLPQSYQINNYKNYHYLLKNKIWVTQRMDFFRRLFGFSDQRPKPYDFQRDNAPRIPSSEDHSRFFDDKTLIEPPNRDHGMNFNVFTDPLEMHRYFEQQMDSFFKHFGMPNFGQFFDSFEHSDLHKDNEHYQHPRDEFVKRSRVEEKVDKDLDGKLNISDLETLFQNPSSKQDAIVPKNDDNILSKHFGSRPFFNQSVQVRTIRKADGSYETRRTVRDNEGNEETTITRKIGDKEFTFLKRRDREGKEEVLETMTNLNEDDKPTPAKPFFDNSLFDKFFK